MTQTIRFIKPSDLRATVRGLAIMSVLFDERRGWRYWTDSTTAADVACWSDGDAKSCCCLFVPKGTIIIGSDQSSAYFAAAKGDAEVPRTALFEELPDELKELVNRQPFADKFSIADATFCIWTTSKGLDWKKVKTDSAKREAGDPDGSKYLLSRLKEYFDHFDHEMDEEYEQSFDGDTLYQVFSGEVVTAEDLRRLKSSVDLAEIRDSLKALGVVV